MPEENKNEPQKTGLYERTVQRITEAVKPRLHKVTQGFVEKSVEKYAPNNPRYARMIEFEVRRRGDGAGLTQDVAEPLLWAGVKTVAALAIAVATQSIQKGKFKLIGAAAALGLIANNAVELFRLIPRYKAGLQGSLEMAKDRWHSIEETGVDPFNQQQTTREINHNKENPVKDPVGERGVTEQFANEKLKATPINPTSFIQQAEKTMPPNGRAS